MINVRQLILDDIDSLKLPEQWQKTRYEQYLSADVGPAYLIEDEQGPLCAFGIAFKWGDTSSGEVWFRLVTKRKTFQQLRITKRYLENHIAKMKIRRCESPVKCGFDAAIKFIEYLGFRNETPFGMKKFDPNGNDAYLYARITEVA